MKSSLYTVVQNTSGVAMRFGFLPPHGQLLTPGQLFTVFGDLRSAIMRGARNTSRRDHSALIAALESGKLTIIHTPSPIMRDLFSGQPKLIQLYNGTLSLVNPGWTTSTETSIPA
jgi:hypothetical protein